MLANSVKDRGSRRVRGLFIAAAVGIVAAIALGTLRPGPQAIAQPPAQLDADLAAIPADALGFVHLRAAELVRHPKFAPIRDTFLKAGPKALAHLDTLSVPPISTLERVTLVVIGQKDEEPFAYVIFRFTADVDPARVAAAYLPAAERLATPRGPIYHGREPFVLYFPDRRHIVAGQRSKIRDLLQYFQGEVAADGPLTGAIRKASQTHLTVALNPKALQLMPPEVFPLPKREREFLLPLLAAESYTATLQLGEELQVEIVGQFATPEAAEKAEKAVYAAIHRLRQESTAGAIIEVEQTLYRLRAKEGPDDALGTLMQGVAMTYALGALRQLDEWLAQPEKLLRRQGRQLVARFSVSPDNLANLQVPVIGIGVLLPGVQKVREAAARATSQNNLKQILVALHIFHDIYGHLPGNIVDRNGKPLLSWRVAILPFLEQQDLYEQFRLDEPWDSPHNKALLAKMPKVYESPLYPAPPGMTYYQGFSGPGTIFEPGKKVKFLEITDGTSNTIAVIEGGSPVPWTKPEDIPFDPKKRLPPLAPAKDAKVIHAAFADGAVRTIRVTLPEDTWRRLIQRNDGQVIPDLDK